MKKQKPTPKAKPAHHAKAAPAKTAKAKKAAPDLHPALSHDLHPDLAHEIALDLAHQFALENARAIAPVLAPEKPAARRPSTEETKQLIAALAAMATAIAGRFGNFPALTPLQRRRFLASGVRRYGFLDKVFDVSENNMEFAPAAFDRNVFYQALRAIEELRNILVAIDQLRTVVDDHLLQVGDRAFRLALIYYNTVRDLARAGVPGARDVFLAINLFFRRGRIKDGSEPTEREALRDVRGLLRGTRDGEIEIESHRAAAAGRERLIVDETTPRTKRNLNAAKATVSANAATGATSTIGAAAIK